MTANGDAFAALDAHIARLRRVPELAREAAPEVAHAFERELEQQITRAAGPDGAAWAPRQDGQKALQTAGKALAVVAVGTTVFARLRGHVARHHLGRVKGGVQRPILPSGEIPDPVVRAITRVLAARFHALMEGK